MSQGERFLHTLNQDPAGADQLPFEAGLLIPESVFQAGERFCLFSLFHHGQLTLTLHKI